MPNSFRLACGFFNGRHENKSDLETSGDPENPQKDLNWSHSLPPEMFYEMFYSNVHMQQPEKSEIFIRFIAVAFIKQ